MTQNKLKEQIKSFNIISWNCSMAFRNKYHKLDSNSVDLLIIQECEAPEVMESKGFELEHNDYIWIGCNKNKGVAAISLGETSIWRDSAYSDDYKYILPIRTNIIDELILCVWTQNTNNKKNSYIAQLNRAVKYYSNIYSDEKLVIIGDFNSNSTFDDKFKHRIENHTMLVSFLNANDIYSLYHHKHSEMHGAETRPTFFLQKDKTKKFQIDYAFVPSKYLDYSTFSIGNIIRYIEHSDHLPIFIGLKDKLNL